MDDNIIAKSKVKVIHEKIKDYMKISGNKNVVLLLGYLIVQTILFGCLTPWFLTIENLQNLMRQTAELGMVTIPLAIILITGNIDMSIGSVMGVCAISLAKMLKAGIPIPLAMFLVIILGGLIGMLNGFFVAKLHLAGIVATLGTQVMLRGVCYILANGRPVSGLPTAFTSISKIKIMGMSVSFIILVIMYIAAIILMQKTTFGIKVHAIGYNATASIFSGIKADKIKFWLFAVSGCIAALASSFMLMRFGSAEAEFASGYDTTTLVAILLGGVSIAGGSGNMIGVLFGLIAVATLQNGLNHMNVTSIQQRFVLGLLILISAINRRKKD